VCDACDGWIEEYHKTAMLQADEWRATAVGADPDTIGFHLSALYSRVGWLSWADISRMWEAAQSTDEAKRSFKNSVLGETWVEIGEAPDWQRLYERREAWHDVQKDRIEVDVWAWGRGLESWLVDHIVIDDGKQEWRLHCPIPHAETGSYLRNPRAPRRAPPVLRYCCQSCP
jgi:phage terminase large subunit GpA-like protein